MSDIASQALQKIESREAVIGVVGLGYVGLPLALAFADRGFTVIGFDIDAKKIEAIEAGRSYLSHIDGAKVREATESGRFTATDVFSRSERVDALAICVPTPLDAHRNPDLSYVENTAKQVALHLKPGVLVSLESTTYPGTTRELLVPILEKGSGLRAGVNLFIAFSPEREDPNNAHYSTTTIPKIVGGLDEDSGRIAEALYAAIVPRVVRVRSADVAESAKLLENIFRAVNVALVNEMKVVLDRMGIDVWEVIEAAATKPFGFMPFYPGPGLGGHCIPIDPFYLVWKARQYDQPCRFIELAGEINTRMPEYVVEKTWQALNREGKAVRGAHVLVVGLAYKPNIDDTRESPSLELIELLEGLGADVDFHDPYVPVLPHTRRHAALAGRHSVALDDLDAYDAIVIATHHASVDHKALANVDTVIVDTRNAVAGATGRARVVKA